MPDFGDLKRLHIDGLADYHCHTEYSIDATGTIDEYCEAALQRGLAEICLTTHYDSNPRADGAANYIRVNGTQKQATPENLAPYVEEVRKAWSTYYSLGLSIKLGLEFGWYPGCEEDVLRLKKMYDFDYLLCGVHELDDICFCCTKTYEQCFRRFPLEKMVELYYADATQAAKSGLFDTLAHLDYYKKFGERFYGPRVHEVHQPFLAPLFDALISTNTAIE
ncbi:MAG TPA: histidinol-phosphatase HisJ family protein, partial [Candidatus Acidoferrum sp.]|nr:histidinol-phosphatase HisJ family protein [Candidatus Acidoferrum sp.]